MIFDDWPYAQTPSIAPLWWIGPQFIAAPTDAQYAAMAQAQAAEYARIEKLREDYVGLDDDALRFRLGEETIALTAWMNLNALNRTPEELVEMRRQDRDRSDRMAASDRRSPD